MPFLAASAVALRFPDQPTAPRHPLPKPLHGRYDLIRFVRHDGRINLFGEALRVPPEAVHTYMHATIDVGRESLSVILDGRVIDQHRFSYDDP